ncbi:MAG: fumarylacetoacetate hydrolase family protein [Candidatus Cybelea sp.]|jgi:2-keto-4-pentenoate hydratase/2-oxohepta-3-ene-1,7-dioic acid hydratase in catechol pathway
MTNDVASDSVSGLTFTTLRDGGIDHLGIRTRRGIVDVSQAARALGVSTPPQTVDDLLAGRGDIGSIQRIAEQAPAAAIRAEHVVEFGPLVSAPPKIICIGLNYRGHLAETGMSPQTVPDLFNKHNTALNHNGTIAISTIDATEFDYESELVVLMGKEARNVSVADALSYVFGYTAGDDFSARDLQLRTSQWMTGKTPDQFAPIGPWLVPADQIGDPQTLQIQTFVNDEITPRQDANTSQMIFSVAQIISYTSKFITFQPGDVIFTGTPSGVILGHPKDKQIWLKPGDRITTRISKLGELRVTLV